MRVLYLDPNDPAEANFSCEVKELAGRFYGEVERELANGGNLPNFCIHEFRLEACCYAPECFPEASASELPVLVLRGESPPLQPLAEWVVGLAPGALGVKVVGHTPPLLPSVAFSRVAQTAGVDLRGIRFRVGVGRGHLLELVAHLPKRALLPNSGDTQGGSAPPFQLGPHVEAERREAVEGGVEALVEDLLGQELFERWVGEISFEQMPTNTGLRLVKSGQERTLHAASELYSTVRAVEADIHAGLSQVLWSENYGATWSMLELEPSEPARDQRQPDLAVAVTCYPELVRCFLSGASFDSRRFSAKNERFVVIAVLILGAQAVRFSAKECLEKAFDQQLRTAKLGAVIGVGTGVRYLYFTLALSNIAGSNIAGSNIAGSNIALSNIAGSNIAGSNIAGSNIAGSNIAGSNIALSVSLLRGELAKVVGVERASLLFMDSKWANEWIELFP